MTIADINLLFIWRWPYVLIIPAVLMLCVVLQLPHRTGLRCFYCQMSARVQNKDVDASRQTDTEVFVFTPPPPCQWSAGITLKSPHRTVPCPRLKQTLINLSFWVSDSIPREMMLVINRIRLFIYEYSRYDAKWSNKAWEAVLCCELKDG